MGSPESLPEPRVYVGGAKTPYGELRAPYVANPDQSRDPPEDEEFNAMHGRPGAKLWRKARMGKL